MAIFKVTNTTAEGQGHGHIAMLHIDECDSIRPRPWPHSCAGRSYKYHYVANGTIVGWKDRSNLSEMEGHPGTGAFLRSAVKLGRLPALCLADYDPLNACISDQTASVDFNMACGGSQLSPMQVRLRLT